MGYSGDFEAAYYILGCLTFGCQVLDLLSKIEFSGEESTCREQVRVKAKGMR